MGVSIRKWELSDKTSLAQNLNNPKVLQNLRDGIPYPYTIQDAEDFIRTMLSAEKENTFSFAIALDNQAIGSIGVFRRDDRSGEIGYYIGEPYWGNGYMTDAVKQICRYVFAHSDIVRIYAEVYAHNTASCRVLEKAGFHYEGTLQNRMKIYALIKIS